MIDIVKRWLPILNQLNIDKDYWEDIALYCEKKSFKEKDNTVQHLPVALKVLSELDLSRVVFTDYQDICEKRMVYVNVTREQISEMKYVTGIDMISMIERRLMDCVKEDLIQKINEEGGVIINDLCANIITDVESMSPGIRMDSYYLSHNVYRFKKLKKIRNKINERRYI
jgi:hypothetical protein